MLIYFEEIFLCFFMTRQSYRGGQVRVKWRKQDSHYIY